MEAVGLFIMKRIDLICGIKSMNKCHAIFNLVYELLHIFK